MVSRAEAFAAYTNDIYAQYDARIESVVANSDLRLSAAETEYKNLGSMGDGDIMAIAFIVLMEAAKSAREDLKAIMAEMQAAQQAKERLREAQQRLKDQVKDLEDDSADDERNNGGVSRFDPCAVVDTDLAVQMLIMVAAKQSDDELQALADEVIVVRERRKRAKKRGASREERDALDEMGELEQLRLQMLLDRRSKLMSTLSNILKKLSETQEAIVENLK